MQTKNNRKLMAVDLFAGAGGFSLAAIKAGFAIDFAIENDKYAVQTYQNNILKLEGGKYTSVLNDSILDYDPIELQKARFKNKNCDLLLGGPPCQGFSTHRILNAGVNDPRNELVLAYFEFVKALQPRVFLMENVPGILWPRHREYLDKFYQEGKKAGYHVFQPVTLDARDFGVPQRRKRVFILGVRDKADISRVQWPPKPTHTDPKKLGNGLLPWVSCKTAFRSTSADDENNIHMNHGYELIEAFKRTPLNGGSRKDSGRILNCHKDHDGHKDVYGRIDPEQPAPTMTTACINPSKGRFVHPTEHHGITVRQAARIQTFPDSYSFCGGLTAAGKQIGNAVPVELGKYLLEYIKAHIFDSKDFKDEKQMHIKQSGYELA
ncbi:DNA cytosine methyltransferase [Alteromonas gilva]|uniref:Cytosine-specific methyltransferase n=1 Tax=Alteromonas gilva TaxID=2987522 RepID=A0ABT5KXL0_9ALTE|nr:DNA cytosine methyltransferase [Alteromonas gilva]MDC8829500.1 DNA cytosine methyltransferase [Alteromonas gilva]